MAEQPVNLSTVLYLGVFSRAEQRVLQAIFKAIAEGNGRCVATLAMLARDSNTSKSTTRNAIAQAVAIGLLKKTERRSYCAVSLPNILTYGEAIMVSHTKATHDLRSKPHSSADDARRAYSDGDRGHDDAGSEVDLTLLNASPRPLAGLPELC
jgi:hypothetical protein